MRENNCRRRSGLFLLELMAAILLFSLAAAVCVQTFAKARQLSRDAVMLSEAVSCCSDTAELFRAADSAADMEALFKELFEAVPTEDGALSAGLSGGCSLKLSLSGEGSLCCAGIEYLDPAGESVYSLRLSRFFKEAAG